MTKLQLLIFSGIVSDDYSIVDGGFVFGTGCELLPPSLLESNSQPNVFYPYYHLANLICWFQTKRRRVFLTLGSVSDFGGSFHALVN